MVTKKFIPASKILSLKKKNEKIESELSKIKKDTRKNNERKRRY